MNAEKYLPVGSVVLLKNGKKRVMVTGFAAIAPETGDKMFDYMGCLYPEGVISSDKNLLFDHEQIDKIYYMGYRDEEWKKTEAKIKAIVEKKMSMQANEWVAPEKNNNEVKEQSQSKATSDDLFRVNTDLFN